MKRFILCLILALPALHTLQGADVAVMVKQHTNHSKFSDRPYGNSDLSYGAFLEIFDGTAGWRLGALYGSDPSGAGEVDSVITPELTLLLQDGIWEAGVSALIDYIDDGNSNGWGDHYYQFQLGLNFPVGKSMSIGGHAFYAFDRFGNLNDFRFNNLDYGLTFRFRF
ncbi:MAG: hypothetical protein JJU05_14525 [Verrucomicrobia bacterium]|nr:hypothetical protein [Verrucomicrobiota bacterium]MCH8528303.1 hypothetical protein [Kiritimatiellia bacterium]